jgi:predicted ArsR family transcriptional regulator
MRKAQRERQERERKLRIQTIKDFLLSRNTATTQEIAKHLNLKENATKRYLRSCSDFEEIRINVWKYDEIPLPF